MSMLRTLTVLTAFFLLCWLAAPRHGWILRALPQPERKL